jgi:hypothetical protein
MSGEAITMGTAFAQQALPVILFAVWVCVIVAQFVRARAKQRAYLRRFPPVDGVPLDSYVSGTSPRVRRAVFKALRERQPDPELERLRREVRRNGYYIGVLAVVVPLMVMVVFAVLALTGRIHG